VVKVVDFWPISLTPLKLLSSLILTSSFKILKHEKEFPRSVQYNCHVFPHVNPLNLVVMKVTINKCLRQMEHSCGHLWHRYSVTVNQVATVNFQSDYFNLTIETLVLVASLLAASLYQGNPAKKWYAVEYWINRDLYTGAAGMLLHINGKFTMGKFKSSLE
jgi:hypothetical protein